MEIETRLSNQPVCNDRTIRERKTARNMEAAVSKVLRLFRQTFRHASLKSFIPFYLIFFMFCWEKKLSAIGVLNFISSICMTVF